MTIPGIDYYSGDGSPNLVGETFAFIKSTEGLTYVDPPYDAQRQRIYAAGAVFGAYHFGWPIHSPYDQADWFLEHAKPQRGDVLYSDLETYPHDENVAGMTPAQIEQWNLAFVGRVARLTAPLGCQVGTYADLALWDQLPLKQPGDFLIVADYNATAPVTRPPWAFWQHGTGGVDYDAAAFSTAADLRAWARNSPPSILEDDVNTTSDPTTGRAGLSWAAGSRHVLQVGYASAGVPVMELDVELTLTTGPWYSADNGGAWKLAKGTGTWGIPQAVLSICRGAIVTWSAGSVHVPYDLTAV